MPPLSLSAALYIAGSCLYVAASVLLLPAYIARHFSDSIALFVAGSVAYTATALLDQRSAVAAVLASRPAAADLLSAPFRTEAAEPKWRPFRCGEAHESLAVCTLYLCGGLLFLAGSVLYLPQCGLSEAGTLTFRGGSCAYICGSALSALRALQAPRRGQPPPPLNALGLAALCQFSCGSSLYIAGGAEFESGAARAGAVAWLIGSVAFLTGSVSSAVGAAGAAGAEEERDAEQGQAEQ